MAFPLSLATTHGIKFFSFPPGTKMFQFPGCASSRYEFGDDDHAQHGTSNNQWLIYK